MNEKIKKRLFSALGFFFLAMGIIGIALPLVPTTPFVLLSVSCFSVSHSRFEAVLERNRWFGPIITNYRTKQGFSKRQKTLTLIWLWLGLISSMIITRNTTTYIILPIVGAGVTIHILALKTKKSSPAIEAETKK